MPRNGLCLCVIRRMCKTVEASDRWGRTYVTKKKLLETLALFRKSCTFASQFRKEDPDGLQNEA